MRRIISLLCVCVLMTVGAGAQETANSQQARRIFSQAYQKIYGQQGATFHYDINILGIYKAEGTNWMKGLKSKSTTPNSLIWNNGKLKYIFRKKKKVVEIYDGVNDQKDELLAKFKFEPDAYTYSIANDPEGFLITLKRKKNADGMKEVRAIVDRKTYEPKHLKIKVAFFWANIKLTNFKSGDLDDSIFEFPREQYKQYPISDER